MDEATSESEREEFRPVAEWVEDPKSQQVGADRKIIQLPSHPRLLAGVGSN